MSDAIPPQLRPFVEKPVRDESETDFLTDKASLHPDLVRLNEQFQQELRRHESVCESILSSSKRPIGSVPAMGASGVGVAVVASPAAGAPAPPLATVAPLASPLSPAALKADQQHFLRAALELLQGRADWRAQVLEEHRRMCPALPAKNEVIMTGSLKKAREGQFLHWKPKFVALSPGKMTYLESGPSERAGKDGGELQLGMAGMGGVANAMTGMMKRGKKNIDGTRREAQVKQRASKTIDLVPGRCYCRPVDNKRFREAGKFVFEIVVLTTLPPSTGARAAMSGKRNAQPRDRESVRLWMAKSEDERTRWIHAIRTAMCAELLPDSHASDIARCAKLTHRVRRAEHRDGYVKALLHHSQRPPPCGATNDEGATGGGGGGGGRAEQGAAAAAAGFPARRMVRVPVEWVQGE